jgi:putative addiction module component (TIGR02574 family)
MTRLQSIETEALSLNPEERAALVEALQASLDTPEAIEQAWAAEVKRRIADIDSGAVQMVPYEDVLAELRAAIK